MMVMTTMVVVVRMIFLYSKGSRIYKTLCGCCRRTLGHEVMLGRQMRI